MVQTISNPHNHDIKFTADHDGCLIDTEGEVTIQSLLNKYNQAFGLVGYQQMDMPFYKEYGASQGNEALTKLLLKGYQEKYHVTLAEPENAEQVKEITKAAYDNREDDVINAWIAAEGTEKQPKAMKNIGSVFTSMQQQGVKVRISASNSMMRILIQAKKALNMNKKTYTDFLNVQNIITHEAHTKFPGLDEDNAIAKKNDKDGSHYAFVIGHANEVEEKLKYKNKDAQESLAANVVTFGPSDPDMTITMEDSAKGYYNYVMAALVTGHTAYFIHNVTFKENQEKEIAKVLQMRDAIIEKKFQETGVDLTDYIPVPAVIRNGDMEEVYAPINEWTQNKEVRIPGNIHRQLFNEYHCC